MVFGPDCGRVVGERSKVEAPPLGGAETQFSTGRFGPIDCRTETRVTETDKAIRALSYYPPPRGAHVLEVSGVYVVSLHDASERESSRIECISYEKAQALMARWMQRDAKDFKELGL